MPPAAQKARLHIWQLNDRPFARGLRRAFVVGTMLGVLLFSSIVVVIMSLLTDYCYRLSCSLDVQEADEGMLNPRGPLTWERTRHTNWSGP